METAPATQSSVETLLQRIWVLVAERQVLREQAASREALERNRLGIASSQRELSLALIARHLLKPASEEAA